MSDFKDRFMSLLNTEEGRENREVVKQKVVCVFRLHSYDDGESAGEALKKGFIVLLDVSGCERGDATRIKDFMRGVAYPMQVWIQELNEDIYGYFPDGYQIQEFA